jgi:hypothetical protein
MDPKTKKCCICEKRFPMDSIKIVYAKDYQPKRKYGDCIPQLVETFYCIKCFNLRGLE